MPVFPISTNRRPLYCPIGFYNRVGTYLKKPAKSLERRSMLRYLKKDRSLKPGGKKWCILQGQAGHYHSVIEALEDYLISLVVLKHFPQIIPIMSWNKNLNGGASK